MAERRVLTSLCSVDVAVELISDLRWRRAARIGPDDQISDALALMNVKVKGFDYQRLAGPKERNPPSTELAQHKDLTVPRRSTEQARTPENEAMRDPEVYALET